MNRTPRQFHLHRRTRKYLLRAAWICLLLALAFGLGLLATRIGLAATPTPETPAPPTASPSIQAATAPTPGLWESCWVDGLRKCAPRLLREQPGWVVTVVIIIAGLALGIFWFAKHAFGGAGKSIEEVSKKKVDEVLQPKPSATEVEQKYLKAMIDEWKSFKFRGAHLSARDIQPPELETAYVSLRLSPRIPVKEKDEAGKNRKAIHEPMPDNAPPTEPVELSEAFGFSNTLAVIGPAGAGKSTLLQWAGLACAHQCRGEALKHEQLVFVEALGQQALLPVLVTLRDFNYWCKSEKRKRERTPSALLDFMQEFFSEQHPSVNLPVDFFQTVLKKGCLLMLDGVDELEEDDRARVGEAIEGLRQEFQSQPANRFLLTSRPTGYLAPGQASDFLRCDVEPLTPEQRNALIADWFEAIFPADEASLEAGKLVQRLVENDQLQQLASTPLMVTILALVQRELGRLPHQRAELYEEAIFYILNESGKVGEAARILKEWGGRSPEQRRNCLAPIAFELQLIPERRHALRRGDLACKKRVLDAFRADEDPLDTAEKFIEKVAERGGLLDKNQGEFGFFTHNMFREFLAGRYLAEELQEQWSQILAERVPDNLWSEVILLAAGYLAIKSEEKANRFILTLAELGGSEALRAQSLALACQAITDLPEKSVFLNTRKKVQEASLEMMTANPPRVEPRLRASLGLALGAVGDTRLRPGGMPELLTIPAGPFRMGTNLDEPALKDQQVTIFKSENPEHPVTISYDFQVGKYPVTNAEYRAFFLAGGYDVEKWGNCWSDEGKEWLADDKRIQPAYWDDLRWNCSNQPVVGVTWFEAEAYCNWLTRVLQASGELSSELHFRLPTEAEWEKTARLPPAPSKTNFFWPWGDEWDARRCNNDESKDSLNRTSPVGIYPNGANCLGVMDLVGNTWEWCHDFYDDKEYENRVKTRQPIIDPTGPASGQARVVRGGSWVYSRSYARSSSRSWSGPGYFGSSVGFRLVLSPIRS